MVTSRMNTVQEPLTDAAFNPPSFPIGNFPEQVRTKEPTDNFTSKPTSRPAASDVQASAVSSRESHGDQELSRVNKVEPERETSPEPLPDRCQFTFSDGRQCRMGRSEIHPSLCRFHAEREDQLFGDPAPGGNVVGAALDLPELHSACRDLTTAAGVNRALAQVFRLLAQRRISRQEAATFGHLAQLLLRTISAMRQENLTIPLGSSGSAAKGYPQDALSPHNKVHGVATGDRAYAGSESDHDPAVERQKGVSSRESHSDQELSRANKVTPLLAHEKDELRGVDKDHQELSGVNKSTSLLAHKKAEPERGSDCAPRMPSWRMAPDSSPQAQAAPAPNSQGPQNEHFHKPHLQLTQNEHLPNCST
jgi:hypothetical protein